MVTHPGAAAAPPGMWRGTASPPLVIAHRGASAYRPEHTLAAYELAVRMGADAIEVDLVATRDGALVARHELVLDGTTDVASHPALWRRRRTGTVDGVEVEGVFCADLTLAELRTLRAVEPWPALRPRSAGYDGRHAIPTLDEVLRLRARLSRRLGRPVGVCLEPKHPSHHVVSGSSVAPALVAALVRHGLDGPGSPAAVQCFEPGLLMAVAGLVRTPLVQLVEPAAAPAHLRASGDGRPYDELCTAAGLREVSTYAVAVGAHKERIIPAGDGPLGPPARFVADAHAAGLAVHAWVFRSENALLPAGLRVAPRDAPPGTPPRPGDHGDALGELAAYVAAGVDGLVTDHPDTAVTARRRAVASRRRRAVAS